MSITCKACGAETIAKGRCPYCRKCCRRRAHCSGRTAPFVVPRSVPRPDR